MLSETTLDFGEVELNRPSHAELRITNEDAFSAVIPHTAPATPFAVDAAPFVIKPGTTTTIDFSFTPTDALLHVADVTLTQAHCAPQVVHLTGLGAGGLQAAELRFGFVPIGQPTTRTLTVRNSRRLAREVTLTTPSKFELSPATLQLPALGEGTVEVTVNPVGPGTLESLVVVRATEPPLDVTVVRVSAFPGEPGFELDPPLLELGLVPVETSTTPFPPTRLRRTLTVRNTGTAALDFAPELRTAGPVPLRFATSFPRALSLFPGELGQLEFDASGAKPGPGDHQWPVFLTTNFDPNFQLVARATVLPESVCRVALEVPPMVELDPPPSVARVKFTNLGDQDCVVDALTVTGPGMALVGEQTQRLVPKHSALTVEVTIDQVANGLLTATVLSDPQPSVAVPLVTR